MNCVLQTTSNHPDFAPSGSHHSSVFSSKFISCAYFFRVKLSASAVVVSLRMHLAVTMEMSELQIEHLCTAEILWQHQEPHGLLSLYVNTARSGDRHQHRGQQCKPEEENVLLSRAGWIFISICRQCNLLFSLRLSVTLQQSCRVWSDVTATCHRTSPSTRFSPNSNIYCSAAPVTLTPQRLQPLFNQESSYWD